MRLVHNHREEPLLPQVPTPLMLVIRPPRIPTMKRSKKFGQAFDGARQNNSVDMIGHQAVRPDLDIDILKHLGREHQIGGVVVVIEKGDLTPDATLGNVVWITRDDQPRKSRHRNLTITCTDREIRSGEAVGHAANMP